MEKVYIVKASSGSWDAYHTWIHAIYLTPEEAEAEKDRLNLEWDAKKNVPSPFPVDEDGDLIDENLSEEDQEKYYDWHEINRNAKEFNGAEVKEYEIGKIIKN